MIKVGFVIADDCEFAPVEKYAMSHGGEKYLKNGDAFVHFSHNDKYEITAVYSGVGKVNAACAAAGLCNEVKPDMIFNFGLSGAINNVYKNEIVVGTKFFEHDFDLSALGYEAGVKPQEVSMFTADEKLNNMLINANENITPCVFVTGDVFVSDKDKKQFIIDKFSGNCCDMESAAIASVCYKYGVAFASLRLLSDDADENAIQIYREVNELEDDALLKIVLKALV